MITPIELHNRQHKTGRGYSRKEMDLFLEEVYSNYEILYKENAELKEKLTQLSDGIQYYKAMENTLQKALVLAEQTSKDTIEAATAKAQLIEKEAGLKADTIVNNALSEAEKIKKECISLLKQYNQFKAQYKQIAVKQIELLDGDFYEIYSKDLIDAINDADVTTETSKTDAIPEAKEEKKSLTIEDNITKENDIAKENNTEDKAVLSETESISADHNSDDISSKVIKDTAPDTKSYEPHESQIAIKEGDTKEFAPVTSEDIDRYVKDSENNADKTQHNSSVNTEIDNTENYASENDDSGHDSADANKTEDPINQLFKELREDLAKDVNDSPFEFIDNE